MIVTDMADWINDQWDEEDWENVPFARNVQCMYCGRWGYEWGLTSHGWRLFTIEGHQLHSCKQHSTTKPVIPNPVRHE